MGKDQDLIQAVKTSDVGTVRKLLGKILSSKSKKGNKKLNINAQDEDGFTALHHTALMGDTEITMALLDIPECNVNARDKKGMSPLHLASWAGKTEIARLLVNYRACVNTCADTGDTPLHLACQHHNAGVVEILLYSNVDCAVVNKNGESALDLACRFGHAQVVELLLKCKDFPKLLELFEVNPKTADPPLHIACKTGREEIVVMLLDAGADVNQRGTNGTALHEASLYGKTDVVKILLDNEADVSITNEEGYTPLDVVNHFTSSGASQAIKDLLKEASKSKVIIAKAVHEYRNLYDPTCLSLKIGDSVEILEKNENGRWKGKVKNGNREIIGYFPSTMVKLQNTKKSSVSGKPLSLKDNAVLPFGKYEMVTLPAATDQSSPVHSNRPRMSSFGKPNDRTPPSQPKRAHASPKHMYPNPVTNGINDNKLFQKTQESLQYVEIAVDPTSATSIKSPTGPRPTEYAEVMLKDESRTEKTPALPEKRFRLQSQGQRETVEEEDDIWIRTADKPEIPPKGNSKTSDKNDLFEFPTNNNEVQTNVEEQSNTIKTERQLKDWEKDLDLEEMSSSRNQSVSSSRDRLESQMSLDKSQVPDNKTLEKSTDTLKANYEDMTMNSQLVSHTKKDNFSPTKVDFSDNNGGLSPGISRRILSYENVELKPRAKDLVQSMLITEVDQDVETQKSHNYENVHTGFDKELPVKNKRENQEYEKMLPEDGQTLPRYETMKRGLSLEDLTQENDVKETKTVLPKSDSYENIEIKPTSSNGSNNHLLVAEPESPSHGYININIPALPEGAAQGSPVQPTGLTMNEYNALYDWLESCKLAIYIDNFVKGGFDMTSITGLTAEDLTAINITKTGHRKKLLSDSAKQTLPDGIFPRERPNDIMTWLRLIHLDQYTPQLMDNGFDDMEFVQDITIEDLESIGIDKPGHQRKLWLAVSALNTAHPSLQEQYLETDLDMVHQNNNNDKGREAIKSTDIDSALSRLPADGASDLCFADEDVNTMVRNKKKDVSNGEQLVDNAVALLKSLDETRGSTPDLDTILDTMDKENGLSTDLRGSPATRTINKGSPSTNNGQDVAITNPPENISPDIQPSQEEIRDSKSAEDVVMQCQPIGTTNSNSDVSHCVAASSSTSLDSLQSSEPADKSTCVSAASSPLLKAKNISNTIEESINSLSMDSLSSRDSPMSSRDSMNNQESAVSRDVKHLNEIIEKEDSSPSRDNSLKDNSQTSMATPSRDKPTNGNSPSPLRARHNSMENKPSISSNQERFRGLSFDSKTSKKPPPPVKPKSFKKPPKIAPKPQISHTAELGERMEENEKLESLQEQIKEVFRKSRENLADSGTSDPSTETRQLHSSEEDLERDQQITDDLMKDINSMLSDFSTEIDCMFDKTTDK